MKKTVWVYGLLAAAIIVGVSATLLWTATDDADYSSGAWLGYLIMIVGFSMIFMATKQLRDQQGGLISFSQAFQVGLWITLIAASFYVLSWELYYQQAGADFMEKYTTSYLENMRLDGADEASIRAAREEMETMGEQYQQLPFRLMVTVMEILPVGLLITLISALLLRNRRA